MWKKGLLIIPLDEAAAFLIIESEEAFQVGLEEAFGYRKRRRNKGRPGIRL